MKNRTGNSLVKNKSSTEEENEKNCSISISKTQHECKTLVLPIRIVFYIMPG